jgi:hypothetical protein
VETKMHGFKCLGERVMVRTFERQVVELHVRVARLNRFTQLGRPTTVPVAATAWLRLGSSRCAFGLCKKAARMPALCNKAYFHPQDHEHVLKQRRVNPDQVNTKTMTGKTAISSSISNITTT